MVEVRYASDSVPLMANCHRDNDSGSRRTCDGLHRNHTAIECRDHTQTRHIICPTDAQTQGGWIRQVCGSPVKVCNTTEFNCNLLSHDVASMSGKLSPDGCTKGCIDIRNDKRQEIPTTATADAHIAEGVNSSGFSG